MTFLRCLLCMSFVVAYAVPSYAVGRVALVIGNSAYKHAAVLDNPVNDANDIAAALEKQKFKVIKGIDLDHAGMLATIRKFSRALSKGDVGVFFYAGHGIQISGKNYLVPTDAKLSDSFGIDFELVRLERIHQAMEQSAKVNIIFLDACRNNPIARNLARSMGTRSAAVGNGLAAMESGIGSLISFSTQPGNVALDGRGMRNSPYSAALAKYIAEGQGDITEILIKVRRDVMSATSQQQVPWEHSALTRQFYFKKPVKAVAKPAQPVTRAPTGMTFQQRAELAHWNSVKDSGDASLLRSYLDQYPKGAFAALARVLVARAEKPLVSASRATVAPSSKTAAAPKLPTGAAASAASVLRDELQPKAVEAAKPSAAAVARKDKPIKVARVDTTTRSPTTTAGAVAAPNKAVTRVDSYRAIQQELLRLKCYAGRADGQWGSRSHLALRRAMGANKVPSRSDMRVLTEPAAELLLTALRELDAEHCPKLQAARTTPSAKPKKKAITSSPRRSTKKTKPRRKKIPTKAKRPVKTKKRPTKTTRASKPKRKAPRKKNCRTEFNQEALVDEKAPKIIRVCR